MPPEPQANASALARWGQWLFRSGRFEPAILIALLAAIIGLWVFGRFALEILAGDTVKFDDRLLLACRQPGNLSQPIGPDWTVQVARDLTAFGGAVGISLVTGGVAGYLALQRRLGLLIYVLVSMVSGMVLALFLKEAFHRPRPQVVPHLTDISTASFPSGHSMLSSVAYLTMAALLARAVPDLKTKLYFMVLAIGLIGLIGCSRVYLGVHYPTDVLAGWGVGSAWAILCALAAHFIAEKRALPLADQLGDSTR